MREIADRERGREEREREESACVESCVMQSNPWFSLIGGCAEEKRKLLREWVISGQNLQACESSIEVSQESGLRGEKVWMQIAVKDMSRKPHHFSEYFCSS